MAEVKTPEAAAIALLDETEELHTAVHVPEHVSTWVEREYKAWQAKDAWRLVRQPTETEAAALLSQAREYTKARSPRLTIQVKQGYPQADGNRTVIAYKVRDKMNRGRKPGSQNADK